MECSICMETITETSIAKTECGHTFHFKCLFHWGRKHNTCPLCRAKLDDTPDDILDSISSGFGREYVMSYLQHIMQPPTENINARMLFNPGLLSRQVQAEFNARPIEQFTGEIDERDVDIVVRDTQVNRETARAYLRYHQGDIVDTIMCLQYTVNMPIPDYRERPRPENQETYVQRAVVGRIPSGRGGDDGYESA